MKPNKTMPTPLLASIGSANLPPELAERINVLQQRWQGVTAATLFVVGPDGEFGEFLTLSTSLTTPLPARAKYELLEIARLLAVPAPAPKPPRFPPPRDDFREVIAGEPGLRGLIEASPVKNLLTSGETNCETFADALFTRDALIKVKGGEVRIATREQLRGKLREYTFISPCVFADRNDAIEARPFQVLCAGGNLDLQAKRVSYIAKSFRLAAVCFDGKNELQAWVKIASDEERERLLCEWSKLAGETQFRPWVRMPDSFRRDLTVSGAYHIIESAGINELLDPLRGIVRQGYDMRQVLLYLSP
jgi:hypothetical protein